VSPGMARSPVKMGRTVRSLVLACSASDSPSALSIWSRALSPIKPASKVSSYFRLGLSAEVKSTRASPYGLSLAVPSPNWSPLFNLAAPCAVTAPVVTTVV